MARRKFIKESTITEGLLLHQSGSLAWAGPNCEVWAAGRRPLRSLGTAARRGDALAILEDAGYDIGRCVLVFE